MLDSVFDRIDEVQQVFLRRGEATTRMQNDDGRDGKVKLNREWGSHVILKPKLIELQPLGKHFH